MTFRILFTDPPWALDSSGRSDLSFADIEREIFGDDFEVIINSAREGRYDLTSPAFYASLGDVDGLVISRLLITPTLLARFNPRLRVVGRQGVGTDNLAPDLLAERGIIGFNIPDYCADEVAAHTCGLVLALERNLIVQHLALSSGTFDPHYGGIPRRLQHCTVGIIGLGRIGRLVATRLKAFYGKIIAHDPHVSEDLMCAYGVEKVDMQQLTSCADIVLFHCALTDDTRQMANEKFFRMLRRAPFIVNTARGAIIAPTALLDALVSGRIAGCALDVFSPERPHDSPEWRMVIDSGRAIVTSHRAYLSDVSERSQRIRAAKGVRDALIDDSSFETRRLGGAVAA